MHTTKQAPKCHYGNGSHNATIKLTYKFPAHTRQSHYTLCDEHRAQFSNKDLVAERRIG